MTTTTVDAAQDALVALLEADVDVAATNAAVDLGLPGLEPDNVHLWVSVNVEDGEWDYPVSGTDVADEVYTLIVLGTVITPQDGNYTDQRGRYVDLFTATVAVVRANPTLSATVDLARPVRFERDQIFPGSRRALSFAIWVDVEAQVCQE